MICSIIIFIIIICFCPQCGREASLTFFISAESKKKEVTVETPKEAQEDKLTVTETTLIEAEKSAKEEIEDIEKLEKEDEAAQAADTKKELDEIAEALTEASKDLAEVEVCTLLQSYN